MNGHWAALRRRPGEVAAIFVLVALVSALAVEAGAPKSDDDSEGWPCVLRHICENPRLHAILGRRAVAPRPEPISAGNPDFLCLVGPYLLTTARICFELYPARGTDELWVLRGGPPPDPSVYSIPVVRLRLTGEYLEVNNLPGGTTNRYRIDAHRELPAILEISGGSLRISPTQSAFFHDMESRFPTISALLPGGGFLAVPCTPDSCQGCGFAALSINLPPDEATKWRMTVGGTD